MKSHPKIVGTDAKVTDHITERQKNLRSISDMVATSCVNKEKETSL